MADEETAEVRTAYLRALGEPLAEVGPTDEARVMFMRALADPRFIPPDGSDPRWRDVYEDQQRRVASAIIASRRDERLSPEDFLRVIDPPGTTFGIGR